MRAPQIEKRWTSIKDFMLDEKIIATDIKPRVDIHNAIKLASNCLNVQFDRDNDNLPYFYCLKRRDGTGVMLHAIEIGVPHVVGRSMLGSQMAESYAGVPFPQDGYDIYKKYCKQSYDNADFLNSYYKDSVRGVDMHNMREGLWSLWAMIAHENSDWAKDMAHKMLLSIDKITDANGYWTQELIKKSKFAIKGGVLVDNQTRMLDPLIAYYEITKDPLALKLSKAYARVGLDNLYDSTGKFTSFRKSSGHIHSITSALSGITRYAIFTKDEEIIKKCKQILDNGIQEYFSTWGWGDEVMHNHPANVLAQGEINQTGDIIRAALYLANGGYVEYYELAERYLRSMLLPAQFHIEDLKQFLRENDKPKNDSEMDILLRCIGSYGFPLPNARMREGVDYPVESQDITSGGLHALVECWSSVYQEKEKYGRLNLLFDFNNDFFDIKSYLPTIGQIEIRAKAKKGLHVRIPNWVERSSIKVIINGEPQKIAFENNYLLFPILEKNTNVSIKFDIPCKVETEIVDGTLYKTSWIGNQIIKVIPIGITSQLPF